MRDRGVEDGRMKDREMKDGKMRDGGMKLEVALCCKHANSSLMFALKNYTTLIFIAELLFLFFDEFSFFSILLLTIIIIIINLVHEAPR